MKMISASWWIHGFLFLLAYLCCVFGIGVGSHGGHPVRGLLILLIGMLLAAYTTNALLNLN